MCGSLKIWKWFVYILSILLAAIGIAFMIVTLIIANKKAIKAIEIDEMVTGFGIAFGILFLILALTGFLSAYREVECLVGLVMYSIIS